MTGNIDKHKSDRLTELEGLAYIQYPPNPSTSWSMKICTGAVDEILPADTERLGSILGPLSIMCRNVYKPVQLKSRKIWLWLAKPSSLSLRLLVTILLMSAEKVVSPLFEDSASEPSPSLLPEDEIRPGHRIARWNEYDRSGRLSASKTGSKVSLLTRVITVVLLR